MKAKILLFVFAVFGLSFGARDLVKIGIHSRSDAVVLDQMGVIINSVEENEIIAELTPEQKTQLQKMGYQIEVLIESIDKIYQENFERGRYLTYNEYIDTMRIIAQNNPNICKLDTLSTTATGYLVLGMKISDSAWVNEPEPRVFFEGDIHGDEKCGWAVCFEMIKYLVRNYGLDPLVTRLVNTREIWLSPTINPYGYVNNYRYNSNSVDLNRNWGYMWRNTSGSSAFSEKETQAMKKAFDRDAFTIWMSYHGGVVVTLYQWGYTTDVPLDTGELKTVCASYAVATNNNYGSIMNKMYYAPGNSCDHLYGAEGVLAIAAEIHTTKTPPASQIDSLFNAHRSPMLNLMRYSKWGMEGVVTDSATGQPITKAMIEPITPARWVSYTDSPNGDYHRYLKSGTYTIKYSANGYNSKTIANIVVPADSSVVINIRLSPNTTQNKFAYKFGVCNVTDPSQAYANHSLSFWALGLRDNRQLSIGVRGWVDLDMGIPIVNNSGNDFIVVENDADVERCTVFVANNWNGPWTRCGVANGTTEFDLQSVGLSQARYVRLKDDGDGTASSPTAGFDVDAVESYTIIGIDEKTTQQVSGVLPTRFIISPNPSNGSVTFRIENANGPELNIKIFDISGRLVKEFILPATNSPGLASQGGMGLLPTVFLWDRKDSDGLPLAAGVYFVQLETGGNKITEKLLLLR